jgi:hypothetical protein
MNSKYSHEQLEELVSYMEEKGLTFSSKRFEPNNRYAILGGKTSVRILEEARDGINGIVLFCYKDKEDLNRINQKYPKEVFSNSESTRPYKISIAYTELDEVIELLLQNELNKAR